MFHPKKQILKRVANNSNSYKQVLLSVRTQLTQNTELIRDRLYRQQDQRDRPQGARPPAVRLEVPPHLSTADMDFKEETFQAVEEEGPQLDPLFHITLLKDGVPEIEETGPSRSPSPIRGEKQKPAAAAAAASADAADVAASRPKSPSEKAVSAGEAGRSPPILLTKKPRILLSTSAQAASCSSYDDDQFSPFPVPPLEEGGRESANNKMEDWENISVLVSTPTPEDDRVCVPQPKLYQLFRERSATVISAPSQLTPDQVSILLYIYITYTALHPFIILFQLERLSIARRVPARFRGVIASLRQPPEIRSTFGRQQDGSFGYLGKIRYF